MKKNPVLTVLIAAALLGAIFFVVLYLLSLLTAGKAPGPLSSLPGADKIALIKIEGVLIAPDSVVKEVNEYAEDSSVKAIVVRVDSPGGGVVAAQEIYNSLKKAKKDGKKVVISMGSVAASGGYYIAAAADRIVANPGTLTGLPASQVRAIADGRIFTGRQALKLKLVDKMGDLQTGIQEAADLAGIKGKPRIVSREKKMPFFEYLKDETASWISCVIQETLDGNHARLQYLYRQ